MHFPWDHRLYDPLPQLLGVRYGCTELLVLWLSVATVHTCMQAAQLHVASLV
jgi:hypothetical protein